MPVFDVLLRYCQLDCIDFGDLPTFFDDGPPVDLFAFVQ